uniref:Uncharacterized protein n=1 Tax=Schizaphis graminum TaxID=13262 RepID=A0A2S2PMA4_SCHGA
MMLNNSSVQENYLIIDLPKAPTTPIGKSLSAKNSTPASLDLISLILLKDISTNSKISSSDIRPLNTSTVDVCAQFTPYSSSDSIIKDKINTEIISLHKSNEHVFIECCDRADS